MIASTSACVSQRVRVVVSEAEVIVREGLAALLGKQADIDVVAMAPAEDEAVAVVAAHGPDVVVMSLTVGPRRFDATRHITALGPAPRIAILAMFDARDEITAAFDAGARACVSRADRCAELLNAIRAVHNGELYASTLVRELLLRGRPTDHESENGPPRRLTTREREIVNMIVAGKTDRTIASILRLSIKTVHTHRMHIMAKFGVHNATMLTRRAIQLGIVKA